MAGYVPSMYKALAKTPAAHEKKKKKKKQWKGEREKRERKEKQEEAENLDSLCINRMLGVVKSHCNPRAVPRGSLAGQPN